MLPSVSRVTAGNATLTQPGNDDDEDVDDDMDGDVDDDMDDDDNEDEDEIGWLQYHPHPIMMKHLPKIWHHHDWTPKRKLFYIDVVVRSTVTALRSQRRALDG